MHVQLVIGHTIPLFSISPILCTQQRDRSRVHITTIARATASCFLLIYLSKFSLVQVGNDSTSSLIRIRCKICSVNHMLNTTQSCVLSTQYESLFPCVIQVYVSKIVIPIIPLSLFLPCNNYFCVQMKR